MSDSIYWKSHDILTRGAMFNFVVGGRGCGKTYDAKITRTRRYVREMRSRRPGSPCEGMRFIYLRRYESELKDRSKFFNDFARAFPDCEFKVEGMTGYVRKVVTKGKPRAWEPLVYFVQLSTTLTKKSVPYNDVDFIVFDEFIIPPGHIRYLPDEVTAFLDFYNTVDRFQDRVRVLFLANSVSMVNPYFLFFGIVPRHGQRFVSSKNGYCCMETVIADEYRRRVSETRFGRMIAGTAYYDYAVGNEYADDDDSFLALKPSTAKCQYVIRFSDKEIGVWEDSATWTYYVSRKTAYNAVVVALTRADLTPNVVMVERSSPLMKALKKLYMTGSLFFDTIETKATVNEIMRYLGL